MFEISIYDEKFPGNNPGWSMRRINNKNGSVSVQIKWHNLWWRTLLDTHPGHGGNIKEFHPNSVDSFLKEIIDRITRFI